MKTRSRNAILAAVMVMAMLGTTAAYAEGMGPGGHHGQERGEKGEFYKELNLTPEQRDQVKAQKEATKAQKQELREAMKAKRAELKAELAKKDLDRARVNVITTEMKAITAKLVDMRVESIIALKKILTPEQFQKMQDKMGQHREKRGKMGGKH